MSRAFDILNSGTQIYDILISSENRTNPNNSSSTNFSIQLSNPINERYLLYALKAATIPKTYYNIDSPRNTFTITDSTGLQNIVVPIGNYTIAQLITEIENQLNALAVDTYTVTYNTISAKITITSTFAGFEINPTLATLQGLILDQLGFNLGVTYTGASITAPNVLDISGIKNVYIVISEFTQYLRNTTNAFQNFKVQMNGQFGDIIYWTDESGYHQYFNIQPSNRSNIRTLNIRLVDEYGIDINLNGREWQFILQLITAP